MAKTIKEINEKIKKGNVVVVTAAEMTDIVSSKGLKTAADEVDVVTTGTFGPMCSSAMYLNVGHPTPRIKFSGSCTLNNVDAYAGLAAVDLFIGATALSSQDPENKVYPGNFKYGGGHVIEDFVNGKDVILKACGYGTDCYPRKNLETKINIKDVNEAVLFNPRNAYQNYNVAVNLSDKIIYTYMGVLKANLGNANYCSAGTLSPLLNDPDFKTIGIGTKIFLAGGVGFVSFWGTQHNTVVPRNKFGVPKSGAGTIAVIGDLKQMSSKYLRGTSMQGYGASLSVGIGIPIPILNEDIAEAASVSDDDITAPIVDYSNSYPNCKPGNLGEVSYAQLRSGEITVKGKKVITGSLSSFKKALEIANELKSWIEKGKFLLTEPVEKIPSSDTGYKIKPLKERPLK